MLAAEFKEKSIKLYHQLPPFARGSVTGCFIYIVLCNDM
jgi:hypothetical protein